MIKKNKNEVVISRETWESLREDDYYREIVEAIEDREELLKSMEEAESFEDFDEYDRKRREKIDVSNSNIK